MYIDPQYSYSEVVESARLNRTRIAPVLSITVWVDLHNQLNHTKLSFLTCG